MPNCPHLQNKECILIFVSELHLVWSDFSFSSTFLVLLQGDRVTPPASWIRGALASYCLRLAMVLAFLCLVTCSSSSPIESCWAYREQLWLLPARHFPQHPALRVLCRDTEFIKHLLLRIRVPEDVYCCLSFPARPVPATECDPHGLHPTNNFKLLEFVSMKVCLLVSTPQKQH